jgi:hypothetical protein
MTLGNQVGTTTPLSTGTAYGTGTGTGTGTTGTGSGTGMGTGAMQSRDRRIGGARETKPFYRTSEFIVFIAMAAVVLVAGYSNNDTLDLFRTWMLVTVLGSAYIVSRGLAKAGAREGTREYGRDIDLR